MKTGLQFAMANIKISSFDALGKALRERFPEIEWPKARALGTRLGELSKGQMGWWSKRPGFVEMLADLLQCAPQDLGISPVAHQTGLFHFKDFPELPPLDLTRDSPCKLGYYVSGKSEESEELAPWFGRVPFQTFREQVPTGVSWLYFPPGTGRDVFWAHLQSRTPYECRSSDTLAKLADRFKRPDPICINIDESAGDRDLRALAARDEGAAILVCAPFRLQTRTRGHRLETDSWEFQKQSRAEQEQQTLTNPVASSRDGGVGRYEWRLHASWRKTLLAWIEKQLAGSDSLFDAKQLENWLAEFTDYALFDTPRAVVAICRHVHFVGVRKLPKPSDRAAGSKLLDLLKTQEQQHDFAEVIHDWLVDLDLPWNGWIEARRWRNYITPRGTEATLNLVKKLADEPGEMERARIAELISERITEQPRLSLADSDLLLQNEKGEIKLRPRFLVDLIARERLLDLIQNHPPAEWAGLCFDPPRRELVHQAMALLSEQELCELAARVIDSYVVDAASIGATEAIFLAVGRRKHLTTPIPTHLLKVAEIVLTRLATRDQFTPTPWSIAYSGEEDVWWTAACWTWSLAYAAPISDVPEDWLSYFPGWVPAGQSIAWLFVPEPDANTAYSDLTAAERYLLSCAEDVAERFPHAPDTSPTVLTPFLLLRGMEQQWDIPLDWWGAVLENKWSEDLVLDRIKRTNAPTNDWLISLTKFLAKPGERFWKAVWVPHGRSPLRRWIFDNADPRHCFAGLDDSEINYLGKRFSELPIPFQCELLERQREHDPQGLFLWDLLDLLDEHHIEVMVPWIGEELVGPSAAGWLWDVSPERAQRLLLSDSSRQVKHHLVDTCPEEQLNLALDIIGREPNLLSASELCDWAIQRLPTAAKLAPRLVSLIQEATNQPS